MSKWRLLGYMVLLFPSLLHAQQRNWNWYLPGGDLFNFSGGAPTLTTGLPVAISGSSTSVAPMSSVQGQPLFYALRGGVRDANYQLMPNSPAPDSIPFIYYSQCAIVVPFPGQAERYVVVHTGGMPTEPATKAITYVVDMTLNAGMGDVVAGSYQVLADSTTAHITAVPDQENGYWLLLHRFRSNAFLAFHLTNNGIGANPVVSNTGPVLLATDPLNTTNGLYVSGTLVADLDGERLAMTASPAGLSSDLIGLLGLYQFNRSSGAVLYQHGLPVGNVVHGVEFSPDGSKLYIVEEEATSSFPMNLVQFTVSASDSLSVAATRYVVSSIPLSGGVGSVVHNVVLCPDGKIRLRCHRDQNSDLTLMDVIHKPDSAGGACQLQLNEFTTSLGTRALPNFCKRYHDSGPAWLSIPESTARSFALWPNPTEGMLQVTFDGPAAQTLVSVVDVTGRLVHGPYPVHGRSASIDLQDEAGGVYFVHIQDRSGTVHTRSVLLAR